MGRLFEFILFAIVAYFVFKFLNRLFSTPSTTNKKNVYSRNNHSKNHNSSSSAEKDINWDAETIDYEEVEKKDNEKK